MSCVLETATTHAEPTLIPQWVKLLYTAFVAVFVPYYLHAYSPTNFLYFCDVALLMTLVAVYTEKALFAAMPAVGIFIPQAFWCAAFSGGLPVSVPRFPSTSSQQLVSVLCTLS